MEENLVIPPVPAGRNDRYRWIDDRVAQGFKVKAACEQAGVPYISYLRLWKQKSLGPEHRTSEAS